MVHHESDSNQNHTEIDASPSLYCGFVGPNFTQESLQADNAVARFHVTADVTIHNEVTHSDMGAVKGIRRHLFVTLDRPFLFLPWRAVSVAWTFNMDAERARQQWKLHNESLDLGTREAAESIKSALKTKITEASESTEAGSSWLKVEIKDLLCCLVLTPRVTAQVDSED